VFQSFNSIFLHACCGAQQLIEIMLECTVQTVDELLVGYAFFTEQCK